MFISSIDVWLCDVGHKVYCLTFYVEPEPEEEIPEPHPIGPSADESLWEKTRCKGDNLLQAMYLSDFEAAQRLFNPPAQTMQSSHTDPNSAKTWGWQLIELDEDGNGPILDFYAGKEYRRHGQGVGHVLKALGVSDKIRKNGGKIRVHAFHHGDLARDEADEEDEDYLPFDKQTYNVEGMTWRVCYAILL